MLRFWLKAASSENSKIGFPTTCKFFKIFTSEDSYLVENYDKKISMRTWEYRDIHWNWGSVRFIQTNTEIPLSTQQQQDEYTLNNRKINIHI